MRTTHSASSASAREGQPQAVSFIIALALVALLIAALLQRPHDGRLSSILLVCVLFALAVAIALHARLLFLARREQRQTARTLDATEREFQSIFDSTLDAILIIDDRGICLEANPAAIALLGTARPALLGHAIGSFFSHANEDAWRRLACGESGHGEMQLVRRTRDSIVVV